jgi:hypothetical protein
VDSYEETNGQSIIASPYDDSYEAWLEQVEYDTITENDASQMNSEDSDYIYAEWYNSQQDTNIEDKNDNTAFANMSTEWFDSYISTYDDSYDAMVEKVFDDNIAEYASHMDSEDVLDNIAENASHLDSQKVFDDNIAEYASHMDSKEVLDSTFQNPG